MKPRTHLVFLLIALAVFCRAAKPATSAASVASAPSPKPASPATASALAIDISKCDGPFRCQNYLAVAAALQALPETKRAEQLRAWAATASEPISAGRDYNVIVLCRMLFEPKSGQDFRRARIGMSFFAGLDSSKLPANFSVTDMTKIFPLEPIILVHEIPFYVVTGRALAGRPERPSAYVGYCLQELQWTSRRYAPASATDLKNALDEALKRPWPQALSPQEIKFLSDQILP